MVRPYEKPEVVAFAGYGLQLALGTGQCNTGTQYGTGSKGCVSGCAAYKVTCGDGGWPYITCSGGSVPELDTKTQCCSGSKAEINTKKLTGSCGTGYCAGVDGCSVGTLHDPLVHCS